MFTSFDGKVYFNKMKHEICVLFKNKGAFQITRKTIGLPESAIIWQLACVALFGSANTTTENWPPTVKFIQKFHAHPITFVLSNSQAPLRPLCPRGNSVMPACNPWINSNHRIRHEWSRHSATEFLVLESSAIANISNFEHILFSIPLNWAPNGKNSNTAELTFYII